MKFIALTLLLQLCCLSRILAASFSFHLLGDPNNLDPALIRGSAGSYLYANIYRSLYRYTTSEGLIPEGAKSCQWSSKLTLSCQLNPEIKWSNGKVVVASDYVRAWRRLVDPKVKTVRSELLLNIKNASAILTGKKTSQSLGVTATSPSTLVIDFEKPDPEFIYKMTDPALAPLLSTDFPKHQEAFKLITNGPYQIKSWEPNKKIILKPNPHYQKSKNKTRPNVEVFFIDDDETALRLFDTGHLSFLRRVPSAHIPKYKTHPGFIQVPLARFDYIGFGPELKKYPDLRKALSLSLQYKQLQDLYHALGRPGCPSLPRSFMDVQPCYEFNLTQAKKALANVPEDIKNKRLAFQFSQMGGDDISRGMEWAQHQWKKHLGVSVELQPQEQQVYLRNLGFKPPAIFRKGVGIDRPTCLAALEVFTTNGSENFIQFKNKEYQKVVEDLGQAQTKSEKKRLCSHGIKLLLNNYALIPLGEIHFTMIHNQKFTGWSINELNQLDLTDLRKID